MDQMLVATAAELDFDAFQRSSGVANGLEWLHGNGFDRSEEL